jgi:hypothetical protein
LKLNAKILRELRLIRYGTLSEPDEAELTPLGRNVLDFVDDPAHRCSVGQPTRLRPDRGRCFKPSTAHLGD